MDWSHHLAQRSHHLKSSIIREILKLSRKPNIISFAGGLPAPDLFPIEQLRGPAERVLVERGAKALQYSTTEGHFPLREWIASRLPGSDAQRIRIVSGSQQGLDLAAKVLCDPGDKVAVAAPTYMGALRAFDAYQVDYLTIACDEGGMIPASIEDAFRKKPKLLYVIPDFDNPTGVSLSLARRRQLLELAERYDVPIIEDNPYGELRFEGEALPSLLELSPERVIHTGTFSKIVAPGLRLAWITGPEKVVDVITRAKQATDLHTATFTQLLAVEALASGFLDEHLGKLRRHYRGQRDLMLGALEANVPPGVSWTRPHGGMFLWVTLPEDVNATRLLQRAVEQEVAFVPGEAFFAAGGGENFLRLSYSVATADEIHQGIARLAGVIGEDPGVSRPGVRAREATPGD